MSYTSKQELDRIIAADAPRTPEAHWINRPQQDDVATSSAAVTGNGPTAYFPDQIVMRAGEAEPLPPQF